MVSAKSVQDQLINIGYSGGWNRPETGELSAILLPDEEIFECVNGWYEGGYGLLCATNIRVLLIDKKPFKILNVEDVRFDTINQIDYSHRLLNANICITAGLKSLTFMSYNQPRLRKLISHVQHRMAEIKRLEIAEKTKNEDTIEDLDQQLKAYLLSQYQQHQSQNLQPAISTEQISEITKEQVDEALLSPRPQIESAAIDPSALASGVSASELYEDGVNEIFHKYQSEQPDIAPIKVSVALDISDPLQQNLSQNSHVFDTNPLKIAYSKLPMILRYKKRQVATSTF